MQKTLNNIMDDALLLSAADRATLADRLVESLASDDAGEVLAAWTAEALKRRDDIHTGAVVPIEGPSVLDEARRKVGR